MIIIDDFVKSKEVLDVFSNDDLWNTIRKNGVRSWNGRDDLKNTALESLIWNIKNTFWELEPYEKFEYWVNITWNGKNLDWHQDKDEYLSSRHNKLVFPKAGAVWYGQPHTVEGGYLEILNQENSTTEVERIQPVYNRVVVFDVSKFHRVSPVKSGTRYGLQVNLW